MQVILLRDVAKLGHKYDVKEVRNGFARNYLLPKHMAELASPARVSQLEKRRAEQAAAIAAEHEALKATLDGLEGQTITITTKADEQGHLFKKLRGEDILEAIKAEKGIELPDDSILLDEPLAIVGPHEVAIEHEDKKITISVNIEKEA